MARGPASYYLRARTGRAVVGQALETAILIELERRGLAVTYVRTPENHEVDLLARSATGELEIVQVASEVTETATLERELRALEEIGRLYPKAVRRLLTLTQDSMPARVPAGVIVQPAYEWMLQARTPASAGRLRENERGVLLSGVRSG